MPEKLDAKSDEELMGSYQMGSTAAFEILFQRHSGRVFGFLSKRLNGRREAQDLLQDVFFKLHRSKHQYNRALPFSPWLYSITRSVLLDHLKKRRLEDSVDSREFENMSATEPSVDQASDLITPNLIEALPPAQKQAVSLRVYDDQTFEEIAQRLSTSPENARQLVSRGLKRLRQALGSKKE